MLTNHTAVADMPGALGADSAGRIHLVDLLYRRGFDVTGIFSPEHGFRGKADAGETVGDAVDPSTGIPIRSLYNGNAQRPSERAMQSFDVLIVDMQDVGLRFYTYHISMLRLMEACAAVDKTVIVLDRPNPNGCHIDGPVLEKKYRSGVGMLPVPVLHGLTMGEIARMAIGEGWVAPCALTVVPCRNYTHSTEYLLPVPPSPNLPTQRAVYLYASLCPFEGTIVSVGRGTDLPYECFGHPSLFGFGYIFTPRPTAGAKHPPLEGSECRGINLSTVPLSDARALGFRCVILSMPCLHRMRARNSSRRCSKNWSVRPTSESCCSTEPRRRKSAPAGSLMSSVTVCFGRVTCSIPTDSQARFAENAGLLLLFAEKIVYLHSLYRDLTKSIKPMKVCEITGKVAVVGNNVSHSHHKTKRKFSPNLKTKRFWSEEEGRWITLKVSAAGMKTINKKGLAVALREAAAAKAVY